MIKIAYKILSFLDRRSRRQFYLLLAPMLATSILEMASIGMVLPLSFALLEGGAGKYQKYMAWAPLPSMPADPQQLLFYMIGAFVIFFILKNTAILATLFLITQFTQTKMASFQQQMFGLYLQRPYAFHLQRNTAEIIRNLSSSINSSFDGLRLIMNLLMDVFLAAAACVLLLIIEPKVTVGVGFFLLILGLIFYRILAPLLQRWGKQAFNLEADIIQSITQGFGAIKDVKVLNCHDYLNHAFAGKTNHLAALLTRTITANQSSRLLVETVIILGFVTVVMVLFELRGSVGEVISVIGLFGMAALRLMPSMNRILSSITEIRNRTAMVDALHVDFQNGLRDVERDGGSNTGKTLPFEHEIHLNDLSFRYESAAKEKSALHGINLRIAKGESVGVVGPSGSGKTTLINILMGLLSPDSGKMLIDGVDAFTRLRAWQSRLGYVPQQVYLLDETLRRNIAFGVEDENINEDRLAEVIRMAHLEGLVAELPAGLNTEIGERGMRLSGGQQQRIGIARALYRNPDILVFDEATSALDGKTEHEVTRAIEELSGKKTLIIIAHRLSTVRRCDRIVYMKDGYIKDTGAFDELTERNPDFHRLAQIGNIDVKNGPL